MICVVFLSILRLMGKIFHSTDKTMTTLETKFAQTVAFEHRSDVRTWFYRVALNTCISLDRKKRRSSTVRLTMDINLFEDHDEDTRQVDLLHKRISRLQPFDRAIVLLWLENLSYEEIGQIVGISTKNVSVRLFRIKEQLKNMSND